MSSTLLMRALSLAVLLRRLACTWGVGGRQGWIAVVADGSPAGHRDAEAHSGGLLQERAPCPTARWRGRSVEYLVTVMVESPPSVGAAERKLLAQCVTTPMRQAA